jgi:acyl carrier protein
MTRDEIFQKVRVVLTDVLALDEADVRSDAVLTKDLGAESIDFLDIVFRLEQAFGFKIGQGELFPDKVAQDPEYVQDGKITARGIAALRERLPHADLDKLQADPRLSRVGEIFTVDAIVNFVERKLAAK